MFSAVCRWAESECVRQGLSVTPQNQRSCLGRALHLVRFPLMTVEEFAVGAAQTGNKVATFVIKCKFIIKPEFGLLEKRCVKAWALVL